MLEQYTRYWNNFLQMESSSEILMAVGAFLVFIGILRILKSSLRLIFWVLLSAIGMTSFSYGMTGSGLSLPGTQFDLASFLEQDKELPTDALEVLCQGFTNN